VDQEALVSRLNDPVNRLLMELARLGQSVLAAARIKTSEFGSPDLYLVTCRAEDGRSDEMYKAVQSILRSTNERWIRLTEVKLIGPSEPLARDLMEIAQRIGSDGVSLLSSGELGGTPIFGTAFIYPAVKSAPVSATGS
jgi:hypothetical protein